MLKQIIFGILLGSSSIACYRVDEVSSSPIIGDSASTFWDCSTKNLYYADYFGNGAKPVLFRYNYVTKLHYSATIQGYNAGVSTLIPLNCAPNQFLVTLGTCAVVVYWDGYSSTAIKLREIFCVDQGLSNHVITYSKADPKRRLYAGSAQFSYCDTKIPPESSLYRYDRLQGVVKNFGGIRASAAMDWNLKTGQFYHKDVCQFNIMEYQWSPITGALSNGHPIFQFTDKNSVGNGMTIDKFGMLYVTLFNGSSVVKIDPRTSTLLETYVLPSRFPTSITFCGPRLDALCVNTGNVAVDVNTGTIANTPITPSDGKLYIISDISTRGHCDRKVCF